MILTVLKATFVLSLASSLVACSDLTPDRPEQGRTDPAPHRSPTTVATTRGSSGPAERTIVEYTVGNATLREDESVLRIEEAELLRSTEGDEIFVRATIRRPAEHKDCFLMRRKTWFALRDAIEGEDISEVPEMLETFWADALSTEKLSSGDTYAVSFRQDPEQKGGAAGPRDTPYFVLCYKVTGDGQRTTTWYDAAHVSGTPEAS